MSLETILQVLVVIIIICNNLLSLEKAFDLVIVHQWWYLRVYFKQSQICISLRFAFCLRSHELELYLFQHQIPSSITYDTLL